MLQVHLYTASQDLCKDMGGDGGTVRYVVKRGEEREKNEASRAVRMELWKRLSSEGLLPRLDSRTNKSKEEIGVMLAAVEEESVRRRVEKEMRQRGERRGGRNQ